MELKLEGNIFYLLDAKSEKRLYNTEKEAVSALKTMAGSRTDIDPENIAILEVDTSSDKWMIKAVPWSKIAIELIKGGK